VRRRGGKRGPRWCQPVPAVFLGDWLGLRRLSQEGKEARREEGRPSIIAEGGGELSLLIDLFPGVGGEEKASLAEGKKSASSGTIDVLTEWREKEGNPGFLHEKKKKKFKALLKDGRGRFPFLSSPS